MRHALSPPRGGVTLTPRAAGLLEAADAATAVAVLRRCGENLAR